MITKINKISTEAVEKGTGKGRDEWIKILEKKGLKIATKLQKATKFWPAEEHHQDYYLKTGGTPYCHLPREIF